MWQFKFLQLQDCGHAIQGIRNIWIALASGLPIDPDKFGAYCLEVADLYDAAFNKDGETWYPMSPTLHKILFHGGDIIRLLPPSILMGFLSEEPSERFTNQIIEY